MFKEKTMKVIHEGIINALITVKHEQKLSVRALACQMQASKSVVDSVISRRREPSHAFIEKTSKFLSNYFDQKQNQKGGFSTILRTK
jgi:hypothetical protein